MCEESAPSGGLMLPRRARCVILTDVNANQREAYRRDLTLRPPLRKARQTEPKRFHFAAAELYPALERLENLIIEPTFSVFNDRLTVL